MVIITIVLSFISIKFLAKKIGGKLALLLLFIPVWGTILLLGIASFSVAWLEVLGIPLLFLFAIIIVLILLWGNALDEALKVNKKKSKA